MVRALALGLAALALFPTLASAHGPSRQKVTETVEINAPADKVWAVIGNFQDMSWHPAVAKLEGERRQRRQCNPDADADLGRHHRREAHSERSGQEDLQVRDHQGRSQGAAGQQLLLEPQREGRRRQVDGRVEGRLLSRLHEQRSAAGAERRSGGEGREGRLSRRPRCAEDRRSKPAADARRHCMPRLSSG